MLVEGRKEGRKAKIGLEVERVIRPRAFLPIRETTGWTGIGNNKPVPTVRRMAPLGGEGRVEGRGEGGETMK